MIIFQVMKPQQMKDYENTKTKKIKTQQKTG